MSEYAWSAADFVARQRLDAAAESLDLNTVEHLDRLGVTSGWDCAEIGGGTGTIAAWLADRVAPDGRLLATDLDTRWLESLGKPNLDVRQHDIGQDALEPAAFDLVHCRNVLTHVARWRDGIAHMADSLRPGGWLCVEEPDWIISGLSDPPTPAIAQFWAAVAELTSSRGSDPSVGRKIGAEVHTLGFTDIGRDARAVLSRSALGPQLDALGPILIDAELLTEEDLLKARQEMATPGFTYTPLFVCIWGRRPMD
jgi:SAM-dependent methyltransferase